MPFDDKNISSCLDASYRQTKLKSVLCVPGTELEIEGGRDTATLKLLFGLYVLAFSAGVIGGNTKCSKYFLTRCILIFFGETNWDLCIP